MVQLIVCVKSTGENRLGDSAGRRTSPGEPVDEGQRQTRDAGRTGSSTHADHRSEPGDPSVSTDLESGQLFLKAPSTS